LVLGNLIAKNSPRIKKERMIDEIPIQTNK
jgi:hypothetical protein